MADRLNVLNSLNVDFKSKKKLQNLIRDSAT